MQLIRKNARQQSAESELYLKAKKIFLLVARDLAYFQKFSSKIISYIFIGLLLFLCTGFARKRDRFVSLFFAIYLTTFVASYAITNRMIFQNQEVVSHRYLMNLFFMVLLAISIRTSYRSTAFKRACVAVGLLAILGLYEHFDTYSPVHKFSPSSLITLSEKLNTDNFTRGDLPKFLSLADSYPENQRLYFYAGLKNFDFDGGSRLTDGPIKEALLSLKLPEKKFLLRRLGEIYSEKKIPPPQGFPGKSSDFNQFAYGYIQSSVASTLDPSTQFKHWNSEMENWRAFSEAFWGSAYGCRIQPIGDNPWVARGVGARMRECEQSLKVVFKKITSSGSSANDVFFAWGMGWDLRQKFLEDPYRALLQIRTLPRELHAQAIEGSMFFEDYFGIPGEQSMRKIMDSE